MEEDIRKLAEKEGLTWLLESVRDYHRNRAVDKYGSLKTLQLLKDAQKALEEAREKESLADQRQLQREIQNGHFHVGGRTKAGMPIFWLRIAPGLRTHKDINALCAYYAWAASWFASLQAQVDRSGPDRHPVIVAVFDVGRSPLDFNFQAMSWIASYTARTTALRHLEAKDLEVWFTQPGTGLRLLVSTLSKVFPGQLSKKFRLYDQEEVLARMEDPLEAPPAFRGSPDPYLPSFDKIGEYPKLLSRCGLAQLTIADLHIGRDLEGPRERTRFYETIHPKDINGVHLSLEPLENVGDEVSSLDEDNAYRSLDEELL